MSGNTLVVGALPGSLGAYVKEYLPDDATWTAGLATDDHEPDLPLDVYTLGAQGRISLIAWLEEHEVKNVVCTVGINHPAEIGGNEWLTELEAALEINVTGVMRLLHSWLMAPDTADTHEPGHFVAISSNSAHIARRISLPYCTSKAALSMAIRCAAREVGGRARTIYCYEPCLMNTPQTLQVAADMPYNPRRVMHRIPNQEDVPMGMHPAIVAEIIVANLQTQGLLLNGTCIRLDGGEQ